LVQSFCEANLKINKSWPYVLPANIPRLPQGSGSLGARMARVLNELGPGPVVIVGSDIPGIAPGHVDRAFAALGRAAGCAVNCGFCIASPTPE